MVGFEKFSCVQTSHLAGKSRAERLARSASSYYSTKMFRLESHFENQMTNFLYQRQRRKLESGRKTPKAPDLRASSQLKAARGGEGLKKQW
ncbi:hypothetical protein FRC12_002008 [Ceratobasidium sp. 428]|nr:hypothetical protein FRC12_002008 [Ceratobasidium sp. 428]